MTVDTVQHALNGAVSFVSLLDELVEKTQADPGSPFHTETLEALAELQQEDPPRFEKLLAELKKKTDCRTTELIKLIKQCNKEKKTHTPKQAEMLIELALNSCTLFRTKDRISFADIKVGNHRETWSVDSQDFQRWLEGSFCEPPRADAHGITST